MNLISEEKIEIIERRYGEKISRLGSRVDLFEIEIKENGETLYLEKMNTTLYRKSQSPPRVFINWLFSTQMYKSQTAHNIGSDSCKGFGFVRKAGLRFSISRSSFSKNETNSILKMQKLPSVHNPVKKTLRKWLRRFQEAYCTLKELIQMFLSVNGVALLWLPECPCPSCETELIECIDLLSQKGYTPTSLPVPTETATCCVVTLGLRKLVMQVVPLTRQQYAL